MNWTVTALTEFVQRLMSKGNPLKPCFHAKQTGEPANITGAGTEHTFSLTTEYFDQGGDWSTDTFTAPVTGKYLFCGQAGLYGITSAANAVYFVLRTSNQQVYWYMVNVSPDIASQAAWGGSSIVDMDAGDTAQMRITIGGESSDVNDGQSISFLSGALIS